MILNDNYKLLNGVEIPKLGLGTWFIDDDRVEQAVIDAINIGYRHIDTAQAYGNEAGVGAGIRSCGVPREKIFVTTKVAAEEKTYNDAANSIDKSLLKMGLDYIDMMIIHSPQPWKEWRGNKRYFEENKEVWRALEDAYKVGKLRAIGVSNFLVDDLKNIMSDCTIKPMVNQILSHIGNTPVELIEFCNENGILTEAYSPIAHGEAIKNDVIVNMANRYNVSAAQLCIKYVIELGMVALPKASNIVHMKDKAKLNFSISDIDMEKLKKLSNIKDYGEYSHFPVFSGK
ncbi:MAG: aldo/keto reductase [Clostridia bacterium]|nr:aldo/keto reductase [Clostridia bacterium]